MIDIKLNLKKKKNNNLLRDFISRFKNHSLFFEI